MSELIGISSKTVKPLKFAPGVISTGNEISSITFSPDGKTVYFCRGTEMTRRGEEFTCFIMESQFIDGKWNEAKIVSFSGKYHDVDPFMSPDGKKMFFSSRRPVENSNTDCARIWEVECGKDGWEEPKVLGYPINSGFNDVFPSVTEDGTMYFTSSRPGVKGFSDIFCSKLINGVYSRYERLGDAVNSDGMDFDACISSDERVLIFTRKISDNDCDLFISFKRDNKWANALNMSDMLGMEQMFKYAPSLSSDGKTLFFTSNGDFYYIQLDINK